MAAVEHADVEASVQPPDNEQNDALQSRIKRFKSECDKDVYNLQAHLRLINACRQAGNWEALSDAWQRAYNYVPIPADQFPKWLDDELAHDAPPERIRQLYENFLSDYPVSALWLNYLQWSCSNCTVEQLLQLFERAVAANGLHLLLGSTVWGSYLDVLPLISPQSDGQSSLDNVKALYRRQLVVPLLDMQKTRDDFIKTFGADAMDEHLEDAYAEAYRVMQTLAPFEERLSQARSAKQMSAILNDYLDVEMKSKDVARLVCLFERAVECVSGDQNMWFRYLYWVGRYSKSPELALSVHRRAVRFRPTDPGAIERLLYTMEHCGVAWTEVRTAAFDRLKKKKTYGRFKLPDLLVSVAYQCYRMHLESGGNVAECAEIFEKGKNVLINVLGKHRWDTDGWYRKCWAKFLAKNCDNMEAARSLWESVIAETGGGLASLWIDYIWLERLYGDKARVGKLFGTAAGSVTDHRNVIFTEWLEYLREDGTVLELQNAQEKIRQIKHRSPAESEDQQEQPSTSQKRPVEQNEGLSNKKGDRDSDGFLIPSLPKKPKLKVNQQTTSSDNARTVFVSNLPFTVAADAIRDVFNQVGSVKDVRLVMRTNTRNNGYGYVEFDDEAAAAKALSLDRHPIEGRPMYVSSLRTKNAPRTDFMYSKSIEKNKLFIRNVSPSVTKEVLQEVFRPFGQLRDVRLVCYKSGMPKGLAYVVFDDERTAMEALEKTNGLDLQGCRLSVEISNPPPKTSVSKTIDKAGGLSALETPRRQKIMLPRVVRASSSSSSNGPAK